MSSKRLGYPLIVKPEIEENEIQQLINLTKTDKKIRKYTRDFSRFSTKRKYMEWRENKKFVYTLINEVGGLLGIVWFCKENPPEELPDQKKYPFTASIRLYPPARGKGLAKAFMKICLKDFVSTIVYKGSKNRGIWITILRENVPSRKLQSDIGFKEVMTKGDRVIMVLNP